MSNLAMGHREFTYLCEKWGFTRSRNSSNGHQIMEHSSGGQIALRKSGAINDDTARQAADIVGVSINEFLKGPQQEQKTVKRRKKGSAKTAILDYLIEHGEFRSEGGSAVQDLAQLLGHPQHNIGYNIGQMLNSGEIIIDRHGFKRRAFVISLKPKNADLPTTEVAPIDEDEIVRRIYGPDVFEQVNAQDVANLLFNRMIDIVMSGSSERHERIVDELRQRLAEQIEYGNGVRDKYREVQMEATEANAKVRELTDQLNRLKEQMAKAGPVKPLSREIRNELATLNARRK